MHFRGQRPSRSESVESGPDESIGAVSNVSDYLRRMESGVCTVHTVLRLTALLYAGRDHRDGVRGAVPVLWASGEEAVRAGARSHEPVLVTL